MNSLEDYWCAEDGKLPRAAAPLLYSGAVQRADPCSGNEQGIGFTARGCRTPIAHPRSRRSPGQASPAVRPFR